MKRLAVNLTVAARCSFRSSHINVCVVSPVVSSLMPTRAKKYTCTRIFSTSTGATEDDAVLYETLIKGAMKTSLDDMLARHNYVVKSLGNPENLDSNKIKEYSMELNDLAVVATKYGAIKAIEADVEELQSMLSEAKSSNDQEMADLSKAELDKNLQDMETMELDLLGLLVPRDDTDSGGAVLEVRAGAGGDEASLFGLELLQLYRDYSAAQGWKFDMLRLSKSAAGGCKEAIAAVEGRGAYGRLKFESGVHRVQRVPFNDTRIHTSTVTVAVLPEAKESDIQALDPTDLRIDTFRASGPGGQHVNTTESAVRVTHLPTALSVAIQDERSQHQNREKAMKILLAKLRELEVQQLKEERDSSRQGMVGTGDRSERIRTYNFSANRITDHRIGYSANTLKQMFGKDVSLLGIILDDLGEKERKERLTEFMEGGDLGLDNIGGSSGGGKQQRTSAK